MPGRGRGELAGVDAALELLRPAAPEERGLAAVLGQAPVEEDGEPELVADPALRARAPPRAPPARPRARAGRAERRPPRRCADVLPRARGGRSARPRRRFRRAGVSTSSSPCPTSVKTERWWSQSVWTSSSLRRSRRGARSSAAIASASRPSETFGTDSSGSAHRAGAYERAPGRGPRTTLDVESPVARIAPLPAHVRPPARVPAAVPLVARRSRSSSRSASQAAAIAIAVLTGDVIDRAIDPRTSGMLWVLVALILVVGARPGAPHGRAAPHLRAGRRSASSSTCATRSTRSSCGSRSASTTGTRPGS